jgi:hypothetical protein
MTDCVVTPIGRGRVQVRPGQGPKGRHLPCEFDVVTATRVWSVIPRKVSF